MLADAVKPAPLLGREGLTGSDDGECPRDARPFALAYAIVTL